MPQLLEREQHLQALDAALSESRNGRGKVVVLEGPAGIGKSSVLRSFLDQTSIKSWVGACDDLNIPQTLGPFEDIAQEHPELEEALIDGVTTFRRVMLRQLRDRGPTVFAIEDIQWADKASLDLLTYLTGRLAGVDALVIATMRTGLKVDDPVMRWLGSVRAEHLVRIALTELSEKAVAHLAANSTLDPVVVHRLTDGNPFLVTELLESGASVPRSIKDSVSARLSRLTPEATNVATTLSVVPGDIEWEIVEGLRLHEGDSLADLELEGLILSSPRGVSFRHELLREALEDQISSARRRELNARVLDVLQTVQSAPSRLAHHAAQAGDVDRLIEHSLAAVEQASNSGAHPEAQAHAEALLPHLDRMSGTDRGEVWEKYARECWFNQQYAEALRGIEKAIEIWESANQIERLGSALNRASRLEWTLGRPQRAGELQEKAIEVLKRLPSSKVLIEAYIGLGQHLSLSSRIADALEVLDTAVELAKRHNDGLTIARALGAREPIRMATGDTMEARADGDYAIETFKAANAEDELSVMFGNRLAAALNVLSLDDIDADLERARAFAREVDSANFTIRLAMQESRLHLLRGEWDLAGQAADLVLNTTPDGIRRATALTVRCLLRGRRGESGAIDDLRDVLDLVANSEDIQRIGSAALAAAELTWLGIVDETAVVGQAYSLAEESGYLRWHSDLAIWLRRLGHEAAHSGPAPEPHTLELSGDFLGAAGAWARLGAPYQQALSLAMSSDPQAMRDSVALIEQLGARACRDRVLAIMRDRGINLGRRPNAATRAHPAGLTPRQVDVLKMLSEGLTNQQIADRLFISAKTVEHHVSAVLTKLGVDSRHEAAELFDP